MGERDLVLELRAMCLELQRFVKQRVELENLLTNYIRDYLGWKVVLEEQLIAEGVHGDPHIMVSRLEANDYSEAVELFRQNFGIEIEPLDSPYAWLKDRILRRKSPLSGRFERFIELWEDIRSMERKVERRLLDPLSEFPIYTEYLSKIRGIGPRLAAQIIAYVYPITNYKYPSKLQAKAGITGRHVRMKCEKGHKVIATSEREKCIYPLKKGKKGERCGARVVEVQVVSAPPRRIQGWYVAVDFNLKRIFMQCAFSFEKQKPNESFYRYLYDKAKEYYLNRDKGKITRQHARMRALLWTAHKFIAHLWEVWMRLEGGYDNLPEPYPIAKLGHKKIFPMTDLPSSVCPQFKGVLDIEPKVSPSS